MNPSNASERIDALSHFSTTFVHDINNVLGAIRLCAEMQVMMKENPEKVAQYAQQIIQTVDESSSILYDLMVFAGKRAPAPEKLDLCECVNQVVAKNVDTSLWNLTHQDGALMINANPKLLTRAILNVMQNATAFHAENTPCSLSTQMVSTLPENMILEAEKSDFYAKLSIQNNGIEIPEDFQKQIFEPYITLNNTKSASKGLGLALVYGVVKTAKGGIEVISQNGETLFNFYFPLSTSHEEFFDIINPQGEIIGKAPRKQCHGDPSLLHRAVHVVVYHPETGDILLQKRNHLKDIQPGKWDTAVGGHLDLGENYATAATRELGEELGIKTPQPLEYLFDSQIRNDIESEDVKVFAIQHAGPFTFQKSEIDEVRFFDEKALAELRAHPDKMTHNLALELDKLQSIQRLKV